MELTWQPPSMLGHPPFHKYKLQRTSDPEGQADWMSIDRQVDVESSSFVDQRLQVCQACTLSVASFAFCLA